MVADAVSDEVAVVLTDNVPTAWFGARLAGASPGDTVAAAHRLVSGPVSAGMTGLAAIVTQVTCVIRYSRHAAHGPEEPSGAGSSCRTHGLT